MEHEATPDGDSGSERNPARLGEVGASTAQPGQPPMRIMRHLRAFACSRADNGEEHRRENRKRCQLCLADSLGWPSGLMEMPNRLMLGMPDVVRKTL